MQFAEIGQLDEKQKQEKLAKDYVNILKKGVNALNMVKVDTAKIGKSLVDEYQEALSNPKSYYAKNCKNGMKEIKNSIPHLAVAKAPKEATLEANFMDAAKGTKTADVTKAEGKTFHAGHPKPVKQAPKPPLINEEKIS